MITHIHSATVAVNDQDAALDFYVNTLGWEKGIDNMMGETMRYLTVVPPGAATQLVLAHTSWAGKEPGGNTGISLISSDIEATYETLKSRGVNFTEPLQDMPWGAKATWFTDPDGNQFFLANG